MKKSEMTNRERIHNALNFQDTDRLPWAPLIDDYFIRSLPLQNLHMEIIEAMRYIGCDIIERHVGEPIKEMKGVERRVEKASDGKSYRIWFDTPVGSVFEEHRWSGQTDFISGHLIETVEDLKVCRYIAEHETVRDNIAVFEERDRYIGDDGIATVTSPMSPIQRLLQFHAGVENTVYLMEDYPEEMDALLEAMHESNKKVFHVLKEYPTEAIFDYEDTSSTVMSRKLYTRYSAPMIDDYAKILHGGGKKLITHMCGCLNAFKEEIGMGIQDGVDSVCPPHTGDLYIWEARKAWGNKKVLIGGIDPPALSMMSVVECEETVREIWQHMKDERGFILSTGDAVPFGTPIENMIAITHLVAQL